jgi:hypothetical protein
LRWAGYVAYVGDRKVAHRVRVGRSEGKKPLGKPRDRCENNINMYLKGVGWDHGLD